MSNNRIEARPHEHAEGEGELGGTKAAGPKRALLGLNPRATLVVGQVALFTVLLIGAVLLLESIVNLSRVNPGFRSDHLLTMQLSLAPARYETVQKNVALFDKLLARIQTSPGVRNAAVCRSLPFSAFVRTPSQPADRPPVLMAEWPLVALQEITPAYFRTLEIPLVRGREFTARGDTGATLVALINEKFAREFWTDYPGGLWSAETPFELQAAAFSSQYFPETATRPGG